MNINGNDDDAPEQPLPGEAPLGPPINPDLIRLLETTLREAKQGKWHAAAIILARNDSTVENLQVSPGGAFSMFLAAGCWSAITMLLSFFQPKPQPIVRAVDIPPGIVIPGRQ